MVSSELIKMAVLLNPSSRHECKHWDMLQRFGKFSFVGFQKQLKSVSLLIELVSF